MNSTIDRLSLAFIEKHPASAAAVLETLKPEVATSFFAGIPAKQAAVVLMQMTPAIAQSFLAGLPAERLGAIFNELSIPASAAILRLLPLEDRNSTLQLLDQVRRKALARMVRFSDQAVGARMDPFYPACSGDSTIASLRKRLKTLSVVDFLCVFTLDRSQCPVGVVRVHDAFLSQADQPVSTIAAPCTCRIHGTTHWKDVVGNPDLRRWNALPVVDDENRYVGALREDAIVGQAEESATDSAGARWRRTSLALGEVYRIGLAGILETMEDPKE